MFLPCFRYLEPLCYVFFWLDLLGFDGTAAGVIPRAIGPPVASPTLVSPPPHS